MFELIHVQKSELEKTEKTLQEYNESIDKIHSQKEELMPELERAREAYKKEVDELKEQEKLSKLVFYQHKGASAVCSIVDMLVDIIPRQKC